MDEHGNDNVRKLWKMIKGCRLCPRVCAVDRTAGQLGACRTDSTARVCSAQPHFGEEPALVGDGGSGTIFFSGCNLACVFCQNHDISQTQAGRPCRPDEIAGIALRLREAGCENINFVSPTHVAHAVAESIVIARAQGLDIATIYNCGGYESVETLTLLAGLIDIYMPDFKYADAARGRRYSNVREYPQAATAALAEMFRQVGPLQRDRRGVARRGLMVRHLVLPDDAAGSRRVLETIARTAPGCSVNVMGQYHPAYLAGQYPDLQGPLPAGLLARLRGYADRLGLCREGME